MDAEYFAQDSGDSVIFHPQLQNNDNNKNLTYKKICIELIVKSYVVILITPICKISVILLPCFSL
jgi:hypothetical protein